MEKIKLLNFSIFFSIIFSISIFLWGLNINFFQVRFLYLILILPIIYEIFKKKIHVKKDQIKIITIFLTLISLIMLLNLDNTNQKSIITYIFIFLTFLIILFYGYYLKNIEIIIFTFFVFFAISLLLTGKLLIPFSTINSYDPWTDRCGGIPINFIFNFDQIMGYIYQFFGRYHVYMHMSFYSNFKIGINEFIFKENSHFSILSPALVLFLTSKFIDTKNTFYRIFIIIIFFIIYNKVTTTFFLSIILSFVLIYAFNFKKFSKKKAAVFIILISILAINFINDQNCIKRVDTLVAKIINYSKVYLANSNLEKNKSLKKSDVELNENTNVELPKKNKVGIGNLSTAVLFKSSEIAFESIIDRPFGWGLNNYILANNYYDDVKIYKDYENYKFAKDLNKNDASNTMIKLIVEVGIFSTIILFFLFKYLINSKVPVDEKLFYFSIIISHFIRGVGYFNSGFIIILIFILLRSINTNNINFPYKNL